MESSNGCQVDCSLASSQGEKWAKDKAWLPSTCLPGVRALVACNGYSGKVIAIEDHRFCIDESRVLRHASKYQQLPAYIAQLDNYTEMNARNLLRQIVKHVQALHEHCIVHRALNPENVYVFQVC
jgi:hypothetical protein